jgi:MFS family permease
MTTQLVPPDLEPVRTRYVALYALTMYGMQLTVMLPALFSLAVKIAALDSDDKDITLGLTVGLSSLIGLVALPAAGAMSDRCRSRWGRRRPFLVVGIGLIAAGSTVIAIADSLIYLGLGSAVAASGGACVTAAVAPFIVDLVPAQQRGRVGAVGGVASQLAGVCSPLLGAVLVDNLLALFLTPVAVLAVSGLAYLIAVPDQPRRVPSSRSAARPPAVQTMVASLRQNHDLGWLLIGKFLLQAGLSTFATYQLYFVLDRFGFTPQQAAGRLALVGVLGVLVAISSAILAGMHSDRTGRRKPAIYLGASCVSAGLTLTALTSTVTGYGLGAVIVLLGVGVFGSVDLALYSDLIPAGDDETSTMLSLFHLAGSLPAAVAPIISPAVLSLGGDQRYTILFLCGGAAAIGAALVTSLVADESG